MRVGLIIYGSLGTPSGGYLYDRLLVRHLEEHGHSVSVLSLPWRNYLRHIGDNFSAELARRLLAARVDLWLQDELNHPSLFLLNHRLREHLPPLVSLVHHLRSRERHPPFLMPIYHAVEKRYLQSVDAFIFNSKTTRQAVAETRGISLPPHVVAYPGGNRLRPKTDEETIRQRALRSGALRLLFIGNIIPRKGLHILLKALSRLQPNEFTLKIAGSEDFAPKYAAKMHRLTAKLGLEERVHFLGYCTDDELRRLLHDAHLLVLPSQYEGFGIVYLEAMGFGLPVIASERGAAWEFVQEGKNGFLLPAEEKGAIEALARHLKSLHHDRERLAEMGIAARRRYLIHPTWEESLTQIRHFLEGIRL